MYYIYYCIEHTLLCMYVHFPVSLFVRVDVPTLNFLWVWLALCHIVRTPPNLDKEK